MLTKAGRNARILRAAEIFRRQGVTQDEIGAVVGVSQAQVSRVLQANSVRCTRALEDICLYAERLEGGGVTRDAVRANEELIEALRSVWDGSSAHAKALALVIKSLAVLKR